MADSITEGGVSKILANEATEDLSACVQVLELKRMGSNRFTCILNDGKMRCKALLPVDRSPDVESGKIEDFGVIRVLKYTCSSYQNQTNVIITELDAVSSSLKYEVGKSEPPLKKPKLEADVKPQVKAEFPAKPLAVSLKSAAQIVQEEHGNAAPAARMGISRRVYPLIQLNPYQGSWTIKVKVTGKGPLRSFKNARGEGNVFNVELTDEDGTQIQATMFKEAADKFYEKLQLGKVYYISKGMLRVANKQYSTVKNDYEMTLNVNSVVEEVIDEDGKPTHIPSVPYNFTKIDELGPYVNGRTLVDVIGIVSNVSATMTIRRKSNNEEIPKRDITVVDQSQKNVTISLWNDLALKEGEKLSQIADEAPVVTIRRLRASDFQGVSLSTTTNSMIEINPDIPAAHELRAWYDTDGRSVTYTSAGASLPGGGARSGSRSIYNDRAFLSDITLPSVGDGKPAYFNVRACISFIKPDQSMWYQACSLCNKKVVEENSNFWCEACQKNTESCKRYILLAKLTDSSGEAWVSAFNEQAEHILGHSADELSEIRYQDADQKSYQAELKKAAWAPNVFRVSVVQSEYMNEKRQRITVREVTSIDWTGESKFLLEQIASLKSS